MNVLDPELEQKLRQYRDIFDDAFPTIPFSGYETSEVLKIIDSCVRQKKDVYESGYLTLEEEMVY